MHSDFIYRFAYAFGFGAFWTACVGVLAFFIGYPARDWPNGVLDLLWFVATVFTYFYLKPNAEPDPVRQRDPKSARRVMLLYFITVTVAIVLILIYFDTHPPP